LLPVPRWDPDGRPGRRDGDHPARWLDPRRDGHRGRRPASPLDGVHRNAALRPLIGDERRVEAPEEKHVEQLLALEMIRVTEAAAIDSARFMGRGEKDGADRAAVEAMRRTMDEIEFAG